MAALRRGAACLSFLISSGRVLYCRSRREAVTKFGKWSHIVGTGVAGGTLCAVPFKLDENLTHEFLIRQAASVVSDSSSTFLSRTTFALIHAFSEYSKAVHTLIALQKRYLESLGKLSQSQEDSIWQLIIGQRAEVKDKQERCQHYESTWAHAIKTCEMAVEAAFISGAEQSSVTVQTNIELAKFQVEEVRKLSQDADKKLAEAKAMEVERLASYAASLENTINEEEIPDAYLRED
ncbi:diablo IAP-binding mitochondrial protein-like [Synchiropus picturatus]